jgi:hypothetical protein
MLRLPGASVIGVAFATEGVIVTVRLRRRRRVGAASGTQHSRLTTAVWSDQRGHRKFTVHLLVPETTQPRKRQARQELPVVAASDLSCSSAIVLCLISLRGMRPTVEPTDGAELGCWWVMLKSQPSLSAPAVDLSRRTRVFTDAKPRP